MPHAILPTDPQVSSTVLIEPDGTGTWASVFAVALHVARSRKLIYIDTPKFLNSTIFDLARCASFFAVLLPRSALS